MLVTVTLNPAFDHLLTLEEFHPGTLNRIPLTIRMPGGKGINVACSLATLGEEVIATGFLGGQGCLLFEKALRDIGVTTSFIYVNQEIRTDFFLIEEKLNRQSLVVEKGNPIELRYLNNFKANFQRLLSFAELIEIGGSLPEGVPCIFLKELVAAANKKKVKVALNLPEPTLLECSQGTNQYLVYPDLRETKRMFGKDIYDPQARPIIARELLKRGAEIVLLKFGNLNYLVANANEMWEGEIDLGQFRVMIGIRDAVLAGFIHKYLADKDLAQALKYGLAAGRSTARNKKNYPNSKNEVDDFLPLAKVRKVQS